jgi:hypothetical protein
MHAAHLARFLKSATRTGLTALLLISGGLALGVRVAAAETPAAEKAKRPAEILLGEIKATPYAARADLRRKLQEAEVRFANNLTEWNARKNNLPEKEKAAADVDLKQLVRLREVLKQQVDAVEFAEEATWTSAKYDLYVALQNALAIHQKLMARFGE